MQICRIKRNWFSLRIKKNSVSFRPSQSIFIASFVGKHKEEQGIRRVRAHLTFKSHAAIAMIINTFRDTFCNYYVKRGAITTTTTTTTTLRR